MNKQQFIEELRNHHLLLTPKMIQQFEQYYELLTTYNKVMDLTAVEDEMIYERHFLNSLTIAFNRDFNHLNVCDVGAGAGFPSIPLKIVFPEMKLTIIDPLSKRMDFLRMVIEKLDLKEVHLCYQRAEDASKQSVEQFDVVTARAVAKLNVLCELVGQLVKVGGLFIAMKGEKGLVELNEAQNALKICQMECISQEIFTPSINLIFKKNHSISKKYPRNYATIKAKPL